MITGEGSPASWGITMFSDPDLQEAFEERAAIKEFDAGMTREQAEREAYEEVLLMASTEAA